MMRIAFLSILSTALASPSVELDSVLALTATGRGDVESLLPASDVEASQVKTNEELQALVSTETFYIDGTLTPDSSRMWHQLIDFPELEEPGTCENGDYAIITAAAVAAARKAKFSTDSATPFSAQQILDCTTSNAGNNACLGGSIVTALDYLADEVLCFGSDYPWTAEYSGPGQCEVKRAACLNSAPVTKCGEKNATICGYLEVGEGSMQYAFNPDPLRVGQDALTLAVYHQPVIAVLQLKDAASHDAFKDYTSGTFSSDQCGSGADSTHVPVLVTGYDESQWVIRPALGSGWGEGGTMYLEKGSNVENCFKSAYVPCMRQDCLSI